MPWCHLVFSEKTLVNVVRKISPLSLDETSGGIEHFQNLSKITIGKFKQIVKKINFEIMFYEEKPPLPILSILRFFPLFIREFFASNVVCILKKPDKENNHVENMQKNKRKCERKLFG